MSPKGPCHSMESSHFIDLSHMHFMTKCWIENCLWASEYTVNLSVNYWGLHKYAVSLLPIRGPSFAMKWHACRQKWPCHNLESSHFIDLSHMHFMTNCWIENCLWASEYTVSLSVNYWGSLAKWLERLTHYLSSKLNNEMTLKCLQCHFSIMENMSFYRFVA